MSLDGDGEGDHSLWLEGTASVGAQKGGQGQLYSLVTMLRLRQDCQVVKAAVLNLPHGSSPAASLCEREFKPHSCRVLLHVLASRASLFKLQVMKHQVFL
ncbi:hypothetical protein PGT21_031709 [Puccinia graminis f. sp. tritici]|uniref:Uncharacterized protein n=1 Tax=Puccinia graminis f. sp. tritici TaxID=56615 RepID=A0A5B0MHJ4_PUCGR|nr:hypothetical protein PGT21_031709 [Puccinia graminis f. sp. tritici]